MKKYKYIFILAGLVGLTILGGVTARALKNDEALQDTRLAMVYPEGIGLVSISPKRKMINTLEVNGELMVWVPGGYGWYRADKVGKLLEQEKKEELWGSILFYNFGYLSEKVIKVQEFSEWMDDKKLLVNMGVLRYVKYLSEKNSYIVKDETLKMDANKEVVKLNEIMQRDFADDTVLSEDLRFGVINSSKSEGLARFMADRLEWMGVPVISLETAEEMVKGCRLVINKSSLNLSGVARLKDILGCDVEENTEMSAYEGELYLGDEFASVIQYSSYNNP